jgi:hypothetical protein
MRWGILAVTLVTVQLTFGCDGSKAPQSSRGATAGQHQEPVLPSEPERSELDMKPEQAREEKSAPEIPAPQEDGFETPKGTEDTSDSNAPNSPLEESKIYRRTAQRVGELLSEVEGELRSRTPNQRRIELNLEISNTLIQSALTSEAADKEVWKELQSTREKLVKTWRSR